MSQICIKLSDGIIASVNRIDLKYHYQGVIEAVPGGLTMVAKRHEVPGIQQYINEIQSGKIKGRYCLEPDLMDEVEFWNNHVQDFFLSRCGKCIKEYELEAELEISQKEGQYTIVLESFLSSKELAETPLVELLEKAASNLSFEELKEHCDFVNWGKAID